MEARTWRSYPLIALRETLVNALYHRSYRADAVEPAKVCIFPDRVEITSYPGPMPGIELRHLQPKSRTNSTRCAPPLVPPTTGTPVAVEDACPSRS